MTLSAWDEIRTAYHVARVGTVSGAAEVLGVHHATVIRHIDSLEAQLGVKLFQRHGRGYTATEAGADLLDVAKVADEKFTQLAGRIRGQGAHVSGDLVVTALGHVARTLTPALVRFQQAHPDVVVRLLTGDRVFRLEYGEAHVAVRAGPAPKDPDNVVQPFLDEPVAIYASQGYLAAMGRPDGDTDLARHRFCASDDNDSRAPFNRWLRRTVPADRITFRSTDSDIVTAAVRAGAGMGFLSVFEAAEMPDLVQMVAPRGEWASPLWLVTHVDLHRTVKVQAALAFLKAEAKRWTAGATGE
ncbi:LysR family transcriptional regulator [Oceaniglobus indicus]|uniref:LysR family transcriptional regulator n=1 Tax=Oceaniglobus indicus TaxID=2047749 RepID=UPI000C1A73F9|nr:LysR family transcriptional regulator [Oceaniglobus indicus]